MTNMHLIDLSSVVFMLASSGMVAVALQWLRDLFLDNLLSPRRVSDAQRNAILRALLVLLNFAGVLGLALVTSGQSLSMALVLSAIVAAFPAAGGSHVAYTFVQKGKAGCSLDKQYTHVEAPVPQQQ